MMRRAVLPLTAVLLFAFAVTARAGSVHVAVVPGDRDNPTGFAVTVFEASPGESNDIVIDQDAVGYVYLRDAGAKLAAGAGCAVIDTHAARCSSVVPLTRADVDAGDLSDAVLVTASAPTRSALGVTIHGGDGDDRLSGASTMYGGAGADALVTGQLISTAYGGPGDDELSGGDAPNRLSGDEGADTLDGAGGDDVLSGGPGNDVLRGDSGDDELNGDLGYSSGVREDAVGDDELDGGPGSDTVSYHARIEAVRVDLASPGVAGSTGERDALASIENAGGGRGDDVLAGDDGPNALYGSDGDDDLTGHAGDDKLSDGGGRDTLRGGTGNDRLSAGEIYTYAGGSNHSGDRAFGETGDDVLIASARRVRLDGGNGNDLLWLDTFHPPMSGVRCGTGRDRVRGTLRGQLLGGCETVEVLSARQLDHRVVLTSAIVPRARRGALTLVVATRGAPRYIRRCRGTLRMRVLRPGARSLLAGTRRFSLPRNTNRTVAVRVRGAARKALRRPRAQLKLRLRGTCGGVQRFDLRWRAPPAP